MKRWAWGAAAVAAIAAAIWLVGAMGGGKGGAPAGGGPARESPAAPEAVPPPATPAGPTLSAAAPAPAPGAPAGKDPGKASAAEASANVLHVTGIVVDEAKKPVAGATVEVRDDATSYAAGTSGPDGRFDLAVDVPQGKGALVAICFAREGTRLGWRAAVLRPDPAWPGWSDATGRVRDLGTIALAAAIPVDVLVTADGAPVEGAEVRALLDVSLWQGSFAIARTDATGKAGLVLGSLAGTPDKAYRVVATAGGRGRATATVAIPRTDPGPVRLELPPECVLGVLVMDAANGLPVAGATVSVSETIRMDSNAFAFRSYAPPLTIPPTDSAGRTTIHGLAATDLVGVAAEAPGYARPRPGERPPAATHQNGDEVRVSLARTTTLAWPIVAGERPVPADGTVVTLKPEPGSGPTSLPAQGKMVGGRLVVEGLNPGYASALAYAPDGSIARLWADGKSDVGNETSFRAPRSIEARLTYPDGSPVEGWFVTARNQGNNPMGPSVRTDAAGKALLDGFYGQLVEVYASETSTPWGGTGIGSVDLEKGSGRVEGVVEKARHATARVSLAGKPGLPARPLNFVVNGLPPTATPEYDEAAGTIHFAYRPGRGGRASVTLSAPGWLTATATVPAAPEGADATVDLDLVPAGRFVVRVVGAGGARTRLVVQRWDETKRDWVGTTYDSQVFGGSPDVGLRLDANGVARVETAPPGRYRAVDVSSGACSNVADVVGGAAAVEMVLDLSAAGLGKGRVVVPEGFFAEDVGLVREGAAKTTSAFDPYAFMGGGRDVGVAEDGTFSIRVPGNVPVTLKPVHALLVPAPGDGTVVVTAPCEGVVVRMVRANVATLRFDREPKTPFIGMAGPRRERALLYRGEPRGAPAATLSAVIEGTTARFGGYEPGTWTVWMDVAPFAPVVLKDVVLGAGETDLGSVAFSEGSSIRVTVLVKAGQAFPRVNVWATREGEEPGYHRGADGQSAEIRLSGFGPGRFRVTGSPTMAMGTSVRLSEVVEVDGVHEATLTLDLR